MLNDYTKLLEQTRRFIWSFKRQDNIKYNLGTIKLLNSMKQKSSTEDGNRLNKPIIILIVSVVECILHDFVIRLVQSEDHFPKEIDPTSRQAIKAELESRNYSLHELIVVMQKYSLLGPKETRVYETLEQVHKLRNRLHIVNWFSNFETNEYLVYSNSRLELTVGALEELVRYMSDHYARPWPDTTS